MWQDQARSTDSFARETPDYRQERRTDDQERNAMRAFLQRTEVRLSTMHRVAVGFISGAGLLFLFPVFFKDAILAIVLKLRQMVLRYFQALLVLLWTALISFGLLPFLQDEQGRFAPLFVFAFGYLIWAILTPIVVQLPIRWLLSHTKPETRRENLRRLEQTDALKQFENWTRWLCYVAIAASLLAIFLEIVLRVR